MYINLIISVVIILIIFILINKKNKEKFSVQSDTEFANDYCNTYCERRDHNYDDGFGTKEQCNDKCKENINLNINTLKKGSTQALSNLFNINLIKQIGAKDEIISSQANEISKFEEESILKSNVDGIKALGYISEDDCTIHPTTELCAITKTDIGNKKTIKTQSENGEQSWGLIGTNSGEYGKIGDGKGDNEYGKIGTTTGEYGKIGTNLGEYMSVNQCRTTKSANDAYIRSQCTVANASDKNSYITKYDANVKKQNAISEAEKKVREELADGCLVEIAKNRNDFMRVDDCVLTPKKYAEATRTLGTDNKFTITTPDVAGKKWVEISDEYKDKIQVKRFVNSELENHLIENYNPSDKTQYNVDYKIEVEDAKLSDIKNLGDLLYSDYVEIEIELDGGRGTIKKYFKPVKNDDGGGIDKQWGLIGENDNEYLLRSVAKTLNWCDIGKVCKPINYIDPTSCTFDMIFDEEKLNYIQSDGCSIKKTNLKNHIDATTPPAILKLPYNDGAPESDDINSLWGKIYPDDAPTEEAKNGYYGKIGTESNNYMIRSECSVTNDQFKNWMEKSQCALTHSQKEKNLTVNENGPLNVIKTVGSTETETWGKIGTITGKYGKIGSDNGDYGVIGTSPEQYMLNSDCGINTNIITRDSKLISAKNGSKWGKVSDDDQGVDEGSEGYYGVIGNYNSDDPQSNNKYMKNSECAISTDSIDGNGPITTRDGSSNWGKISAEPGTEGRSTYYGKIGTEDNDYIKNSICNGQKDDHLNTYCKLTNSDFNDQTSTTPNKIEIDTESSWGRIGSGNGYYGKIGEGGGEYMINDDCHTLQTDVNTNNTAIAKDQTYWGKISDTYGGGTTGYYGEIGNIDDPNKYMLNNNCHTLKDRVVGNTATAKDETYWGKIGEDVGSTNHGVAGYYGKIGTEGEEYITNNEASALLGDNCEFIKDAFETNTSMSGKNGRTWGLIGDGSGYYGEIGTYQSDGTNSDKYMKNSDCAIEVKDLNGQNLVYAKDTSEWGKVSEADGSGIGSPGNYGVIGYENDKYMLYQNCELLQSDVSGGIDKLGTSTITQRTWGKVSEADETGFGFDGYYGKIGKGLENNEYGLIGNNETDYMIREKCLYEQQDQSSVVPNIINLKNQGNEWGKIGTITGKYGKIGSDNGDYGVIGTSPEQYMLNSDCGINTNIITRDSKLISAKNGSKWGKVSDDDQGANEGNDGYYGVIGDYNSQDSQSDDKYMKISKCAISTDSIDGNGPITTRDKLSKWGKISAESGTEGTSTYYGKIGTGDNDYIKNSICNSQKDDHLNTYCKLTNSNFNDQTSTTPNKIEIDTESSWGRIGSGNGYYGKIGEGGGEYMINDDCHTLQTDVNTNNTAIAKDQTYWGKISDTYGGGTTGYYGEIGTGNGYYGEIGNINDETKYMLNANCYIESSEVSLSNTDSKLITAKDNSTWGKVSDDAGGRNQGEDEYYGKIGSSDTEYMKNEDCAIYQSQTSGNGPVPTRDGSSNWGKIGDDVGEYGKIGNTAGDYILYETISELESTIQTFDDIEIKNIVLNELLIDHDYDNKTIKSGWVSGNIIDGDDNSKITVFAYKCIKKNSKIYKDDDESSSILRIFKGRITQCVVDSAYGTKRYIYFKDNKNALEQRYINLSKQLGDGWTNENIGNNILCENSELGCIEIEKKP